MKVSALFSSLILQPGRAIAVWAADQLYVKSVSALNFCLSNCLQQRALPTKSFSCATSNAMNHSSVINSISEEKDNKIDTNQIANITSFGDTKTTRISTQNTTGVLMSPTKKTNNRLKINPTKAVDKFRGTVGTNQNRNGFKSNISASNSARLPPISSPGQNRSARKSLDAKSTQTTPTVSQKDASIASLTNTLSNLNLSVTDRRSHLTPSTSPNRNKITERSGNESTVQSGLKSRLSSSSVFQLRKKSSVASPKKQQSYNSLDDIVLGFKGSHFQKVLIVQGAGISTISGIPDFRTKGTGLYSNLQQYNIPYPEAIFDIDYFRTHPKAFYALARELYPSGKYKPNIAHYFARLLHEKNILLRVYTQNIDGLERLAGIPAGLLVEAHGTFAASSCIRCKRSFDNDLMKNAIFSQIIAKCPTCISGLVKPDITFFGEDLPDRFFWYRKDFPQADLVIIMGTSLAVEPFCNIICSTKPNVPRLLINRDKVGIFRSSCRATDISVIGELDVSLDDLIRKLGWTQELKDVIAQHEPTLPKYQESKFEVPAPVKNDQSTANGKVDQANGSKGKSGNKTSWNPRNISRTFVPSKNAATTAVPNSIARRHMGNSNNNYKNCAQNSTETTDTSSSNYSSDSTTSSR